MSARTAIIVGKGGHAHVIASFLAHDEIRFMVPADPQGSDLLQSDFLAAGPDRDADYFIGIGDNAARRGWFDRLAALGVAPSTCIAPSAWVAADARLGAGVFVGAGAIVSARARIGDNVILNTLASVDHDCEIGEDSQFTPGVTLGAEIRIGRACFFGMRACVIPRLTIGDGVVAMAGALVVRSAPDGVLLGGAPARVMRGPAE